MSGKCDDAGGTYIDSQEAAWYVLLLAAAPFSLCPENRKSIFSCCRCGCHPALLRCSTVLRRWCGGSGSMVSLATRYLLPVRTSTSECGMSAECIFIGVLVVLGQAMSVIAFRCCGWSIACGFGKSVEARAGCKAFTLACPDCHTVMQPGGICWSDQVQRDVFLRWPITQIWTLLRSLYLPNCAIYYHFL